MARILIKVARRAAAGLVLLLAAGCGRPVSFQVEISAAGQGAISPADADGVQDVFPFDIVLSGADEKTIVTGYRVSVVGPDATEIWGSGLDEKPARRLLVFRRYAGLALPSRLEWDGKTADGEYAADGSYRLTAEVRDGRGGRGVSGSLEVMVDNTPPSVKVAASSMTFSPDGDGENDTISIPHRDVSDAAAWSAAFSGQGGPAVRKFAWQGGPQDTVWDGKDESGKVVADGRYSYTVSVRDAAGAAASISLEGSTVATMPALDSAKAAVPVYFKAFTADHAGVAKDLAAGNRRNLDRVAFLMKRFPALRLRLDGHAVGMYWNIPTRGATEEAVVLAPLAVRRAEAVRKALVERGVDGRRATVRGFGGTRPAVPHSDLKNRWKNRRVEFIFSQAAR